MLTATIITHAHKYINFDPSFVAKFLESIHVDDLNSGTDDIISAYEFYNKCKQSLADASFNLRKFQSNSPELEELVNDELTILDEQSEYENKVLGLIWDKHQDYF